MKAIFLLKIPLLVLILFTSEFSWSQQHLLDTLQKKFEHYQSSTLTEKIYIHTDRNTYLVGETIWFKAYLTDGLFHRPLDFSKVAYLEILDNKNNVVLQTMFALKDSYGDGSIMLPIDLPTGDYLLRSYTSWMKNFSADYFYYQTLSVINPFRKVETVPTDSTNPISIQFFPEGGNLIMGRKTRIGFQGVTKNGKGASFTGIVVSDKQDTVAVFSPLAFGIGSFTFRPELSNHYKAIIADQQGRISSHDLPRVEENNYSISVREVDSLVQVNIYRPQPIEGLSPVYLLIHARNSLVSSTLKLLTSDSAVYEIPKRKLPDGISHITLFNPDLVPVCERLYFKQPNSKMEITLTLNANTFTSRKKVKLEFDTRINENPISSNLSVSVFLDDSLNSPITNISTYHLLTSDLKGLIENPEFYLTTESAHVREAIDNLMLTHGWRRFKWKDVLTSNQVLTFLPELRGPVLQGTIQTKQGQPLTNNQVYLSLRQNPTHLYSSTSNASGKLFFEIPNLPGSSIIYLQQKEVSDNTVVLQLVSPFYTSRESTVLLSTYTPKISHRDNIENRSVAAQVTNTFAKDVFTHSAPDTTSFYGRADEIYFLDDYTRFPVMEEVMREYVKGVFVKRKKDEFHLIVANKGNGGVFTEPPLILLDGIRLVNEEDMMRLNPLQIKKVEVVNRRYFYGHTSYAGIISLTSISKDSEVELSVNPFKIDYEGLQEQRVFYSPSYETSSAYKDRRPDQRTLLYWNPSVITNSAGHAMLEFFTSDITGKFKIIVEGLTSLGKSGSKEIVFDVTNP
jgi:hypothetical protein